MSVILEFQIFELVFVQNLTSKNYFEFLEKFSQKSYFRKGYF